MNYSKEITEQLVKAYINAPTRDTVRKLAEAHGKSEKSVIGKLSKEGVYIRSVYTTKTGEKPVTKSEIVVELAEKLEVEYSELVGLEKSPKQSLKVLLEAICED